MGRTIPISKFPCIGMNEESVINSQAVDVLKLNLRIYCISIFIVFVIIDVKISISIPE